MVMKAKTLSIKRIRVLLNFIDIIPARYFCIFILFNFRLILLRTDSYCPITKFTVKENRLFMSSLKREIRQFHVVVRVQ